MPETKKLMDQNGAKALFRAVLDRYEAKVNQAGTDITTINEKIGTVPTGKTIVGMISEAQAAATYDDTALAGRVTTAEGKITTLMGSDDAKSVRTIANEELAAQLIPANAQEALDTLQEIAAWIQAHPGDVATINSKISALEALTANLGDDVTVKGYVNAAIQALNIGNYALAADLTALATRVTTLEGKHANGKTVAQEVNDGITALNLATTYDAIGAAATAETNAKAYADGLATNYDAAGSANAVYDAIVALTTAEVQAAVTQAISDYQNQSNNG